MNGKPSIGGNGKLGLVRILPLSSIRPSPQNESIYRPVNDDDPEIQKLAVSIRERGILEPLVVSSDYRILSGHRRYVAAQLAGLTHVPCRIVNISSDDIFFPQLLTEYNQQRVKAIDEVLREEILRANPEDSYAELRRERQQRAQVRTADLTTIELREERFRAEISAAKGPMLEAVRRIIAANEEFWPLSDRQIHYQLLNNPPLIHASKPDSVYRNDRNSYKSLVDLLTRARLEGHIQWEAIADPTRPVALWDVHRSCGDFISEATRNFLQGYWRDLLQSQPNHIEVIGEKNTIQGVIRPICSRFTVPYTIGRGYCSLDPRHQLVDRFYASGKENLILLALSDFDPDGEEIAHSFARSLRDDFGLDEDNIIAIKVALTAEQVDRLGLPPIMSAKATSANYDRFVDENGEDVYELEAVPAGELQRILEKAIQTVLDIDRFNAELEKEKAEAAYLKAFRQTAQRVLGQLEIPPNQENSD
jgi:ParB-like chromosome segregation protein Spo0J